jgi:hypothetical protein
MADYFEKASFTVPLADEEASTVREMVAMLKAFVEAQELHNDPPVVIGAYPSMNELCRYILDNEKDQLTNEYALEEKEGSSHLWVTHDERFDVEEAALLAQAILRQFDKKSFVAFEWACDCSKPRLDAYGGGSCVVTAKVWGCKTTGAMIADLVKEMHTGELLNVQG